MTEEALKDLLTRRLVGRRIAAVSVDWTPREKADGIHVELSLTLDDGTTIDAAGEDMRVMLAKETTP
jgi:uncharacterized protein YajQ (UPF0234 family)